MILMSISPFSGSRGRRAVASVLVAALLSGAAAISGRPPAVSVASAADPSSDIPGVPLPGAVVTGRLGGSIYDVVYSFWVAPGYVILASLTGSAGTDFDIYLFDSTATSVLSPTGLLTKSIGPTSTESISWPSRFGGTYYLDLNGATDVQGDFRLTVQAAPDSTPPAASISLAGGLASTNQLTVPVTLTASDDLSGVTEMALSADGLTFSDWQPFQRSTTWTFLPGDGPRNLWAKVRNGVGLESAAATAAISIDTVPPAAIAIDPAPGSNVAGLHPTFTVTFDEPIATATWTDMGLIVQSATGALISGSYAYDPATRTGRFTPSAALQPGAAHIVTLGNVTDVAGNRVSSAGSWSITPLAATSLTAAATGRVVLRGGSSRIDVTLTGAPLPASIEVLSATSSGTSVSLGTMPVAGGLLSLGVTPDSNTTYSFRYGGAFGVAPAEVDVPVLVRRTVALAGRDSRVISKARVGVSVNLTAALEPAAAGISVSFRLYRFDAVRRAWVYAGSRGRGTDAAGRASYTWVPSTPGSWYWRVVVASTADYANNVSPVYRWSVSR